MTCYAGQAPLVSFTGRGSYVHRTYSDKIYPCVTHPHRLGQNPPLRVFTQMSNTFWPKGRQREQVARGERNSKFGLLKFLNG